MAKPKRKASLADTADKYALYRLAVQDPEHEVKEFARFYRDEYGEQPSSLREDFCAAAAICCEWVKRGRDRTATGVDLDPEPLRYGRAHYLNELLDDEQRRRVTLLQDNVLTCRARADVIAAQNYSFYIFKERDLLRRYFKGVHASLREQGVFVLDVMGGGAMQQDDVVEVRQVARPTREDKEKNPPFKYVWEQVSFDPITHDALFHIHFRFPDGSAIEKAFTYDWRMWSIPEVRELLAEAGFSASHVYWETEDKDGNPSGNYRRATKGTADKAWLAYVVAVK